MRFAPTSGSHAAKHNPRQGWGSRSGVQRPAQPRDPGGLEAGWLLGLHQPPEGMPNVKGVALFGIVKALRSFRSIAA
jgi:hypothetical protein